MFLDIKLCSAIGTSCWILWSSSTIWTANGVGHRIESFRRRERAVKRGRPGLCALYDLCLGSANRVQCEQQREKQHVDVDEKNSL